MTIEEYRQTRYPATLIVHTVNGPIACCEEHATRLQRLNAFLGAHTVVEPITDRDDMGECSNCQNEKNIK